MLSSRPARYLIAIVVILLIPFYAMQFTDEVNWTLEDFVVAAVLLGGFAMVYELFRHLVSSPQKRSLIFVLLVVLLIIIWAEMAVGIFGSPLAGS